MNYETVLILDAHLSDAALEAEVNKTAEFIKQKGQLLNTNRWGKRRLAYNIKKKSHGDYTVFSYGGSGKLIDEMEQGFRFNENVLRYLTVRL
jgi:small subunit ribosomal protein S6